jgi:hypothetical protein
MGAHVAIQVGHVGEAFAANLAGERALPLVDGRHVALIFVTFVKTLVAYLNEELLVFKRRPSYQFKKCSTQHKPKL